MLGLSAPSFADLRSPSPPVQGEILSHSRPLREDTPAGVVIGCKVRSKLWLGFVGPHRRPAGGRLSRAAAGEVLVAKGDREQRALGWMVAQGDPLLARPDANLGLAWKALTAALAGGRLSRQGGGRGFGRQRRPGA